MESKELKVETNLEIENKDSEAMKKRFLSYSEKAVKLLKESELKRGKSNE